MFTRNEADQSQLVDGRRGFDAAAVAAGYEPWSETFEIAEIEADPALSGRLGLAAGTSVLRRSRLHGVVEEGARIVVMLSWTWIAPAVVARLPILREASTGEGGLTSRLEEVGYVPHWEVSVESRGARPDEADRLGLLAGAPVLDAWRHCYGQDDQVLEVTRRVINSERHLLVFRYGPRPTDPPTD